MIYSLDLGHQLNIEQEEPVIGNLKDRFSHFYIVGSSGTGKSVFMERMALYDIKKGISVIYIDPKGECVKKLYHLAPDKSRIKYISKNNPIVINPLRKKGYPLDELIDEFVRVLDVLITLTSPNPESTIRMKTLLNKSLKTFSDDQIALKYLADFLEYEDVRKKHRYIDADYEKYWTEFDRKQGLYYVNREYHDTAKSISTRLLQFLDNNQISPFITGDNELYIAEMLKNGQSLLVDTSGMTQTNRIFLTNLIFHAVATYIAYDKLKIPLLVYVDEFQTVASNLIRDILEFGRGEKVGFTLAHHDFSEIKNKDIIKSVISISQNKAVFRCGREENDALSPTLNLKHNELLHLKKFNAWLKLDTDCIAIETFLPIMGEAPDIDLPSQKTPPKTNYLHDGWFSVVK